MRFEFKPSFDKSVKNFQGKEKEEIKQVALLAIDILSQDRVIHKGMGLKRLKGDFWEIRKGLKARILFRWGRGLVEFIHSRPQNRTLWFDFAHHPERKREGQDSDGAWPLSISLQETSGFSPKSFILAGDHDDVKRYLKNI